MAMKKNKRKKFKKSYWTEVEEYNRIRRLETDTTVVNKRILDLYEETQRNIIKDIQKIYGNYTSRNELKDNIAKEYITNLEKKKYLNEVERLMGITTNIELKNDLVKQYNAGSAMYRMSRLENLKGNIKNKITELGIKEEVMNKKHYTNILLNTQKQSAFNNTTKHLVEQALLKSWFGGNYSDRIWNNKDKLQERLEKVLIPGFLQGKDEKVLAREIRDEFKTSNYEAMRLVRTESAYFYGQSTLDSYKARGIKRYKITAKLDLRTSRKCKGLDGNIYQVKDAEVGINYPPFHPFCRTTTVPVYEELEEKEEIENNNDKLVKNNTKKKEEEEKLQNKNYRKVIMPKIKNTEVERTKNTNVKVIEQKENKGFNIITEEWVNTKNKEGSLKELSYSEEDGKRYYVSKGEAVLDHSDREKEVAKIIKEKYKKEVGLRPRILIDDKNTSDYLIDGEKWDLKELTQTGKNTIKNAIQSKRKQASNFILDETNVKFTEEEMLRQINALYMNERVNKWLKKIVILRNDEVVKVFENKKIK